MLRAFWLLLALLLAGVPAAAQTVEALQVGDSSKVFKLGTGIKVHGFTITTGANAVSVGIYDTNAAPAAGTVTPKPCFYVAATTTAVVNFPVPIVFQRGVVATVSSAGCGTYTADTTAHVTAELQ